MGCWRWFNTVLKETGVTVTPQNRAKIDNVIHEYIGAKAEYEHCYLKETVVQTGPRSARESRWKRTRRKSLLKR